MVPKYHRTDSFFRSQGEQGNCIWEKSGYHLNPVQILAPLMPRQYCDVSQYEIFDITQDIYIFSFSQNI